MIWSDNAMLRFQHKQVWIWRCSLQISSAAKPDEDYAIASEMLESQSHTRWLQRPRDMTRCSNRLFSALIAIGLPMWIIYTIVSQSGGSRPPSLCKSYGRGSRPSNFGKLWWTHLIFLPISAVRFSVQVRLLTYQLNGRMDVCIGTQSSWLIKKMYF